MKKCKGCGKQFRKLERHLDYCEKYHMNRKIKKTCRYCGRRFVDLMRHLDYCEEFHMRIINRTLRDLDKMPDIKLEGR